MLSDTIELIVSDEHGIYIPREFALRYDREDWHISEEDHAILVAGPPGGVFSDGDGHPDYWEVWDEVVNNAYYESDGAFGFRAGVWHLVEDGDLWMAHEEHDWEED